MLSLLIFLPAIGAAVVFLLRQELKTEDELDGTPFLSRVVQTLIQPRGIAAVVTLVNLLIAIFMYADFETLDGGLQFTERVKWIETSSITTQYFIGVDGLSATLMLLTGGLFLVAALISWNIELRPREYFGWLLLLETAVMGVFAAQDLILFFLFWELELVPMFLLISIWGTGRKEYSAMKFVLYTLSGSALMRPASNGGASARRF